MFGSIFVSSCVYNISIIYQNKWIFSKFQRHQFHLSGTSEPTVGPRLSWCFRSRSLRSFLRETRFVFLQGLADPDLKDPEKSWKSVEMLEMVSKKSRHLTSIPDPIPHLWMDSHACQKKMTTSNLGEESFMNLPTSKNC